MNKMFIFVSLMSFTSLKGQTLRADTEIFRKSYDFYAENPVFFPQADFMNFTFSKLYFNHNQGNLHLGQQSDEMTYFGLKTHGLFATKKITFFGYADVNRNYQNNKKWSLSSDEVQPNGLMIDPHYYAVSKGSKWNNQYYDLLGGLSLPLKEQKWDLALWVSYYLTEKYRSEYDPRPKITTNKLSFSAQTALNLAVNHKIALLGNYAYWHMDNSMSFSDNDSQTPFYFEKYQRWMAGYGSLQNPLSTSEKKKNNQYAMAVAYHYNSAKNKILATYKYQNSTTDIYKNNNDGDDVANVVARLYATIHTGGVQYFNYVSNQRFLRLHLFASKQKKFNHIEMQNGKNYASNEQNILFESNFLRQKKHTFEEVGAYIRYQYANQRDVIVKTQTEYTAWETGLYASKEYAFAHFVVNPLVRISYLDMHHKLINENDLLNRNIDSSDYALKALQLFYQEVVYFDHNLLNKNQYRIHFGAKFKKKMDNLKSVQWGIFSEYQTTMQGQNSVFFSTSITLHY